MKKYTILVLFVILCLTNCSKPVKTLSSMNLSTDKPVGIINIKGDTLIPFCFDCLISISDDKYIAEYGECTMIIDTLQNVLAELESGCVRPFAPLFLHQDLETREIRDSLWDIYASNYYPPNRLLVEDENQYKYGVIDHYGNEIIPCQYISIKVHWFNKSFIVIEEDYTTSMLDSVGNEIIPPIYDGIQSIMNPHYLRVKNREQYCGLIDLEGNIKLPLVFAEIEALGYKQNIFSVQNKEGLYGILDINGNEIVPFHYQSRLIPRGELIIAQKDGKYGVIDLQNKILVPFIYDVLSTGFNLGRKVNHIFATKDEKQGVIDTGTGQVVIPFEYDEVRFLYITEGYLFIANKGSMTHVLNDSGNTLFTAKDVFMVDQINDNLFKITTELDIDEDSFDMNTVTMATRFVDAKGNNAMRYNFDYIFHLDEFVIVVKDKRYGLLDEKGKFRIPLSYSYLDGIEISETHTNYIVATKDSLVGIIDYTEKAILPFIYEEISSFSDGLLAVKKDGKWGVLDFETNKMIIPFEYDRIGRLYQKDNCFLVEKDRFQGILDGRGKVLLPCIYKGLQNQPDTGSFFPSMNPNLFEIFRP